jgi:predicted kinase
VQNLYLVRGLPSSGKSTLAIQLATFAIAADDFFTEDGVYTFDPSKLPEAHQECQSRCSRGLDAGLDVAVANTFSQAWELVPYLAIAEAAAGEVRVVILDLFDAGCTDAELTARNAHGVPEEVIAGMRKRWEHDWKNGNPLPPWER